jgi:hypothetical protein
MFKLLTYIIYKLNLFIRQRFGTVGLFGAEGINFPFCAFYRFISANLASVGNLFSPLTTLNPHTHAIFCTHPFDFHVTF